MLQTPSAPGSSQAPSERRVSEILLKRLRLRGIGSDCQHFKQPILGLAWMAFRNRGGLRDCLEAVQSRLQLSSHALSEVVGCALNVLAGNVESVSEHLEMMGVGILLYFLESLSVVSLEKCRQWIDVELGDV